MASEKKSTKTDEKSTKEIFEEFQTLRNDQRRMAIKLSEMEMELNEHKIVIDTLKGVDKTKKCFRLVGGVLCERTVGDVLPALIQNTDQLAKLISAMNDRLATKGKEINDYKEKHNIRIREQDQEETQQPEEESNESKRSAVVVNPVGLD